MNKFTNAALALCALAGAAFFLSATWMLWKAPNLLLHADGTLTRSEALISKTYSTMGNLDKATKVWGDSAKEQADDVHSMIRKLDGTIKAAGGTIRSIGKTSDAATAEINALRKTTDAATDLTVQARTDLKTLDGSIAASKPLLEAYTAAGTHLDALITDPNWRASLFHVAGITTSADGIAADFKRAADKATDDYLRPVPWYMRPVAKFGTTWDILGAVARHTP